MVLLNIIVFLLFILCAFCGVVYFIVLAALAGQALRAVFGRSPRTLPTPTLRVPGPYDFC
jgi:hypothetical protein